MPTLFSCAVELSARLARASRESLTRSRRLSLLLALAVAAFAPLSVRAAESVDESAEAEVSDVDLAAILIGARKERGHAVL